MRRHLQGPRPVSAAPLVTARLPPALAARAPTWPLTRATGPDPRQRGRAPARALLSPAGRSGEAGVPSVWRPLVSIWRAGVTAGQPGRCVSGSGAHPGPFSIDSEVTGQVSTQPLYYSSGSDSGCPS